MIRSGTANQLLEFGRFADKGNLTGTAGLRWAASRLHVAFLSAASVVV